MIRYGTSFNSTYDKALTYTDFFNGDEIVKGTDEITKTNNKTLHSNLQALLTYDKQFGDHEIGILAGISKVEDETDYISANRNGGSLDILDELAAGDPSSQTNDGYSYGHGLLSYFGRVNYSFDNKYLFEANIRRDGSSRFSEENRWGVFPSFSVGWRISQESFMENVDLFEDLRIRASWGELGNQEIGNYPYQAVMKLGYDYPFAGQLSSEARMTNAANSEISWERTQITNFGVDGILLKGKIDFAFEYYIKNTDDILLQLPIPATVGQNNASYSGYYYKKYIPEVINGGWDGNSTNDIIIIRYAEVLFTYAEAKIELGKIDQSVLKAINDVRRRESVSLPDITTLNQNQLRSVLRKERRVEFAMEEHRLFDIRRWKIAEEVMSGSVYGILNYWNSEHSDYDEHVLVEERQFDPQKDYLWPIPQSEMDINEQLYQNPGW
jgi:hypothetical protein